MKRIALLMLLWAPSSWSQAGTGNARTTGACSPAVTGNNNTFTITCEGLPQAKADEMVRLMNTILRKQLDPGQVYSQLNQIQNDISNLGVMINPIPNLPPTQAELLRKSQDMQKACYEFVQGWQRAMGDKAAEANKLFQARVEQKRLEIQQRDAQMRTYHPYGEQDPLKAPADAERTAEYKRVLAPELNRYEDGILTRMPGTRTDYSQSVNSAADLLQACNSLAFLTGRFIKTTGDASITRNWTVVKADCTNFYSKWNLSYMAAGRVSAAVNQEHEAEYMKKLAPRLMGWRAQIVTQIPGVSTINDYTVVNSMSEMSGVCEDTMKLTNAYQTKIVTEVQRKHQLP